MVDEIAHETGTVRVVTEDFAVTKAQRIDRAGQRRARRQARGKPPGRLLERYGDVGAGNGGCCAGFRQYRQGQTGAEV